jgi:hypothetical protein
MSLPIIMILRNTTRTQLYAAINWTADNLHVPVNEVPDIVAIAYVQRHFKAGQLEGWDGFVTDLGN